MSSLSIRFASRNEQKIDETSRILTPESVQVLPLNIIIEELQTENTEKLVKDKAMRAFREVGRPLFVEHTGLYLKHLHGLPGGLTQIFWDRLKADRFSELFGNSSDPQATARTLIGYINGRKFYGFDGEIAGRIASEPAGPREFQWDCVFIPEGHDETFAEMGELKDTISMRKLALDKLAEFLHSEVLP